MAAYAHNFVVSIVGPTGTPVREAQEAGDRTVRLPFESEYKIRLKNKNQVRAKASVLIDGMDISPGRMLILRPGQTLDLERFIQDGDLDRGARFKFVERDKGAATGEIQDPTNPKLGTIEVVFHKELLNQAGVITTTGFSSGGILRSRGMSGQGVDSSGVIGHAYSSAYVNSLGGAVGATNSVTNCAINPPASNPAPTSDVGGTAMGSESAQKFQDSNQWFPTEAPFHLIIHVKGLKKSPPKVEMPDAREIIERGLSEQATPEERELARAYLVVLDHQRKSK